MELNKLFEKVLKEGSHGEDACDKVYEIFKKACEEAAQIVEIDADDLQEYIGTYFSDHDIFYYG